MDLFKQIVMGSGITRDYEVSRHPIGSSGLWRIHGATKKSQADKAVSVFIYEKKPLDSIPGFSSSTLTAKETEKIFEVLKKEASQLSRLRHPYILRVTESIEETRLSLTFAAEPLQICLNNLLTHDLSIGTDYELDALEIQKGLLQLTKALQFCHNDAKIVHGNITPNSIFVTPEGDWKLGGFGFCTYVQYTNDEAGQAAYFEHDSKLPSSCQQNLDYAAPEFVLEHRCCLEGDMFSLGCLIYAVFNAGKTLLKTRNNLLTYRNQADRVDSLPLDNTPKYFESLVRRLTCRESSRRPSASALEGSPAFDNILVRTMRFLETLAGHLFEDKVKFFQGLKNILPQFPERLLFKKILPALLEETKATELLPYTLPNIVFITDKLTLREFTDLALPTLRVAFSVKGPSSALASLLNCLESLVPKATETDFREHFLPCVYTSLESQDPTLQDNVLRKIPTFVDQLDYTVVKNSLYPKIQALYARTNLLSIKVGVLECFHSLLKVLDKNIMTDKLVPLLQNTKTKEPGVQLAMLAIYQELGLRYLESEAVACKIIPELWKISINTSLNLTQFQKITTSINLLSQKLQKDLSDRIRSSGNMDRPTPQKNGSKPSAPLDFESLVKGSSNMDQPSKTLWSDSKFKDTSSQKNSDTVGWEDMFKKDSNPNLNARPNSIPKSQPIKKFQPQVNNTKVNTIAKPIHQPSLPSIRPPPLQSQSQLKTPIIASTARPMSLKPPGKLQSNPKSDWEMFDPLL